MKTLCMVARVARSATMRRCSKPPLKPLTPALPTRLVASAAVPGGAGREAGSSGAGAGAGLSPTLHATAGEGPQPETLFRPDAASLAGRASAAADGGRGPEGEPLKEGELPGFEAIPHPDYEGERPQQQTAPEPDNPLPEGLPPNHPKEGEEAPPDAPQPPLEVPLPRRTEPDVPTEFPPDIIPSPTPLEAPQRSPPTEVPGTPAAPPEFTPGAPSELPQRGGSEITFP